MHSFGRLRVGVTLWDVFWPHVVAREAATGVRVVHDGARRRVGRTAASSATGRRGCRRARTTVRADDVRCGYAVAQRSEALAVQLQALGLLTGAANLRGWKGEGWRWEVDWRGNGA